MADTGTNTAAPQQAAVPVVDYTKIQQMLEGTLAAKEDTALKAQQYFQEETSKAKGEDFCFGEAAPETEGKCNPKWEAAGAGHGSRYGA